MNNCSYFSGPIIKPILHLTGIMRAVQSSPQTQKPKQIGVLEMYLLADWLEGFQLCDASWCDVFQFIKKIQLNVASLI